MSNVNDRSAIFKQFAKPILLGVLVGTLVCAIALMLLAFLAASFDIPQAAVVPLAMTAAAVGSFAGGFIGGVTAKKNGWLIGAATALLLYVVSVLAGLALFEHINGNVILIKVAVMLACGIFGGVIAVNYAHERKRRKR